MDLLEALAEVSRAGVAWIDGTGHLEGIELQVAGEASDPVRALKGRFTLLQIDAHIDWRDEVDGERLGLSSTMRRASEMTHIDRMIQVGQRGVVGFEAVEVFPRSAQEIDADELKQVLARHHLKLAAVGTGA